MHHRPLALVGEIALVVLVCSVFAFLVVSFARSSSATFDETTRLPAGFSYLRWHDYRLNPDHPPLLKKLAALPVLWQPVWPSDLRTTEAEMVDYLSVDWQSLPDTQSVLKSAWMLSVTQYFQQWIFGHFFLYGVREQTLERLRQQDPAIRGPYTISTVERLSKDDFYNDADALLFNARMVVMLLGILLAVLVYLWSRALFGIPGAVLSILLFCLDPNIIAHSGLVTTDIGVTLFIFGALYFLWRLCCRLEFVSLILFLLFFALAFVTKFSSAVLLLLFWCSAVSWMIAGQPWPVGDGSKIRLNRFSAKALVFLGLFLIAMAMIVFAIWASYDFRYSATQTADGSGNVLIEEALHREAAIKTELQFWPDGVSPERRAEFENQIAQLATEKPLTVQGKLVLFAKRQRLFPEAYLFGLAHVEMGSIVRDSFLRGERSSSGFRSYYLWTLLLKTPLPALVLTAAALVTIFVRGVAQTWQIAFLACQIAVYYLSVSIFTNLNIGHRHLLPIYPFLYVFCGVLGAHWMRLRPALQRLSAGIAITAVVISCQFVFYPFWCPARIHPHYLAYFNEIAGGPRNGYKNLVDSNLDWGQELKNLQRWLDQRKIEEPIWLSYFGTADPNWHQIRHRNVPRELGGYLFESSAYASVPTKDATDKFVGDLRPGQYIAISATNLSGVYLGDRARDVWRRILDNSTFVDQIGYSLFVYRFGREE